jgi:hypothetical protein
MLRKHWCRQGEDEHFQSVLWRRGILHSVWARSWCAPLLRMMFLRAVGNWQVAELESWTSVIDDIIKGNEPKKAKVNDARGRPFWVYSCNSPSYSPEKETSFKLKWIFFFSSFAAGCLDNTKEQSSHFLITRLPTGTVWLRSGKSASPPSFSSLN